MLKLSSPAKINWFLKVLGRRADGFHDIYTVMQTIGLRDTLYFEKAKGEIEVESELPLPPEENLVYRAAMLLRKETGCSHGARIRLVKEIPLEAGLGGGSSNAAATLVGLNRLWERNLDGKSLSRLGAALGSDVPFFLNGPFCAVEGRGDVVRPLRAPRKRIPLLIIKPEQGISTAHAYRGVKTCSEKDGSLQELLAALLEGENPGSLAQILGNDLEEPAFRLLPAIREIKEALLAGGAAAALMCGSGSSVFGVFHTKADAEEAAATFRDLWHVVTETENDCMLR